MHLENLLLQLRERVQTLFSDKALVSILCASVVVHIVPFLFHGAHPLGYDTGFYRRFLVNPLVSFPNTAVPGVDHTIILPRIFLDVFRAFGLSTDVTLYGSFILSFVLLTVFFYLLTRFYVGRKIALLAALLLVFSPIQYHAYWFILYKNILGLVLLFGALYSFEKRYLLPSLLFSVAIPITHQGTTIIFLAIFAGFLGIRLLKKEPILQELIIFGLTLSMYLFFHPNVVHKISAPPVGVFLDKPMFFLLALPLLVLVLFNLRATFLLLRKYPTLLALTVVTVLFPILSLPYYQRIFLLLDVALIILASHSAVVLWREQERRKVFLKVLVVFLCTLYFGLLVGQVYRLKPLISNEHVSELEHMSNILSEKDFVLTSVRLTPWVHGWARAKVYAPGILKDTKELDEWYTYWEHRSEYEDMQFLSTFPQPLYIFADSFEEDLFVPPLLCVKKLSGMLYKYECHRSERQLDTTGGSTLY